MAKKTGPRGFHIDIQHTSPLEYKNPAFPVSLVISEYSISDIKVTLETQLSIGRDDEAVGNVRGEVIVTDILDDGKLRIRYSDLGLTCLLQILYSSRGPEGMPSPAAGIMSEYPPSW